MVLKQPFCNSGGGCCLLRGSCAGSLLLQFSWALESVGQLESDPFGWNHMLVIAMSLILGTLAHPIGELMGILFPCQYLSLRDNELLF